jgi:hypothetical protein
MLPTDLVTPICDVCSCPGSGHIAAPQRADAKGPIVVNDDENDTGGLFILRSKN